MVVYSAQAGSKLPQRMIDRTYSTLALDYPVQQVLRVTLNRPEAANAFNTQMASDLVDCFEALALTPGDLRCVILTGSGERAFCAGGDLKERDGMSDQAWGAQHRIYERMIRAVLDCPLPLIAAVNGAAFGIIPGAGGTQTLARAVGERRAKELILSARRFDAGEACRWGLVNEVVADGELEDRVLAVAARIAANAPLAVRQAKQAIHRGLQMSLADGLAFEIEAYNRTVPTADRREGVRAFNEKREPQFKGE